MERKNLNAEEINKIMANIKTIFGIEGMEFSDKEIEMGKKFLAGEISFEEYQGMFLKK